ncbi:MBL fold metallo-hydrolase [Bacillus sp. RG28]|uniref:MBL fold metallo-hydrolase n=1 Tax=Gottfriedia endophytica TaxID=2820819 RepID=A0A940NLV1_9BACI|nr:MBL fold metallo-hydrolase [Gottfriedia endophytica]MBP0726850.1 MBL fold metallo-hydrolase [Gottfriedia endophytica]
MLNHICTTCGVQYSKTQDAPSECVICNEERQYINPSGQSWTTLEEMQKSRLYKNEILMEETGLYSITTKPEFAIGQTAYLVQSKNFNMLWDCITYLDESTKEEIHKLGGIHAIALSHPHYYSTQVEWAEAFNVPIYIHEDDKEWVNRPSKQIIFWSGESLELTDEITIYRLGGHFKGGAVLHCNDGKGILLSGDIIQVVSDRKWVSFMYSYPNLIPLPANKVKEMAEKVKELKFNRLYNAFHRVVVEDANQAVQKSAERYIKALEGTLFHT